MARPPKLGEMRVGIQVVRRAQLDPYPGSAEPRHSYEAILTTRASVKSRSGSNEFSRIDIDGKEVSHTFTLRWTSVAFDMRDRIRDARGQLYQILKVENVDLANQILQIQCASVGHEDVPAAL